MFESRTTLGQKYKTNEGTTYKTVEHTKTTLSGKFEALNTNFWSQDIKLIN